MYLTQLDISLIEEIRESLGSWHKYTIAIDGRDGSGKSRLARLLAFKLDMPMIETDLFLIPHQGEPAYRYDDLRRAIETRHQLDRPVIVEGILILHTLAHIGIPHDFLVYVINHDFEGSHTLAPVFEDYEAQFSPRENADFTYAIGQAS
jgi:uridine kinase